MVASPFPAFVGFAALTRDTLGPFTLAPEEQALLGPRCVAKRREEFTLGRAACRAALRQVGFADPPSVLKGQHNEPLWPEGYVGAITHSAHLALCAVCPTTRAAGIGIDLEEMTGDIPAEAFHLVGTGAELTWIGDDPQRFRRLFSAKEAAFKAFSPHAHGYLDFQDAELGWDEAHHAFHGRLRRAVGSAFPAGYAFEVGCRIEGDLIFCYTFISAARP